MSSPTLKTYTVWRVWWGKPLDRQYRDFHSKDKAEKYMDENPGPKNNRRRYTVELKRTTE